ncbi:MAG: TetR/AcrR family transcriptional regulator [Lachnospiraceae bacterium]|nr:TetR/AcrR family transcriptional regulator [Lachnospiraceae bacterium]
MDNREIILKTALSLFCARGYDAVGVQEIVDQAGITKPTLYYYFGSKQGLLKEIVDSNCAALNSGFADATNIQGDISAVLYQVARAYYDFAESHREFYFFMLSQFRSGRETEGFQAVYPQVIKYYRMLVNVFERFSDVLGNMNGRQELFAVSFMGILDSHMLVTLLNRDSVTDLSVSDEKVYEIVRQFLYGIFS